MAQAEPRYVFDTNTLISAALFEGSTPGRAFRLALRTGALLASPETLAELSEVLSRGKLERYVTQEELLHPFRGVSIVTAATLLTPPPM